MSTELLELHCTHLHNGNKHSLSLGWSAGAFLKVSFAQYGWLLIVSPYHPLLCFPKCLHPVPPIALCLLHVARLGFTKCAEHITTAMDPMSYFLSAIMVSYCVCLLKSPLQGSSLAGTLPARHLMVTSSCRKLCNTASFITNSEHDCPFFLTELLAENGTQEVKVIRLLSASP